MYPTLSCLLFIPELFSQIPSRENFLIEVIKQTDLKYNFGHSVSGHSESLKYFQTVEIGSV